MNAVKALAGTVALVALLAARSASADIVPKEMPAGFGGLYFGESVKSAKRKCGESFSVHRVGVGGKSYGQCKLKSMELDLVFNPKGKLFFVSWGISPATYATCAKEILHRIGLEGRGEDEDGLESWALSYDDSQGNWIGGVTCFQNKESPSISFSTSSR